MLFRSLSNLASGELEKTKAIADQIKNLMRQYNSEKSSYEDLRRFVDARVVWPDLLNELQRVTPPNMWFTRINGLSSYQGPGGGAGSGRRTRQMADPDMMGGDMPDMDAPPAPAQEVAWLRLQGHALVLNLKASEGVEEAFRKNVAKSDFFDHDPSSYKNPKLTVNSGDNNITSFVIYIKLKNPIKL